MFCSWCGITAGREKPVISPAGLRMDTATEDVKAMLATIKVLVVDDEYYTRKVIRTLLLTMGCTKIHEAGDGPSGLEAIRNISPDIVLLDWEMPGMDGGEFVRRVRSPSTFPLPAVPIIMLSGHGERSRVLEAVRLGVHEFLLKPVSSSALQARMLSVLTKPRNFVKRGDYYGPEPRKIATYKPEADNYRPEVDRYTLDASPATEPSPGHVISVN
jgi:two-component system, chemotaxis family, chemotaxis protein CheY